MSWVILHSTPNLLRYSCPETGEIIEHKDGFTGLIESYHEYARMLGKVAEALGPEVLTAWEDS